MERALGSRYRLGESLGTGAMGQVYAGVDPDGQEFAFKVLRSDLTGNPDVVARFLQERSILVGLRHPNLVGVHDLVVEGDTVAIVMDLVRGGDLRARLVESGPLLPSEVARMGASVASALVTVHATGVVHRDIKPENILMDGTTPRLTDFGISRLVSESEIGRSSLLAGTPQYVAPELAEGLDAAPAADLYSLGIVLYELSCGVTPFAGGSMLAVIRQHAEQEPGWPPGVPDELWDVISWLLRKSPRGRPQSAQQVATLLDALAPQLLQYPVAQRLTTPPQPATAQAQVPTQMGIVPARPPGPPGRPAAPAQKKRRRVKTWSFAVLLVLAMVGGGVAYGALRPVSETNPDTGAQRGTQAPPTDDTEGAVAPPATATTTEEVLTTAPDLVGMTIAEAQDKLPATVEVEIVDSIQQGAEAGTVVEQEPAAGAALDGHLRLTVARDAMQLYLDEIRPVTGYWYDTDTGAASLAGKTYLHSLPARVTGCREDGVVEYNLAKGFRQLTATAGLDDNSESSEMSVQLEIFADNRPVFSESVAYGTPLPVDLDLSGVLRLKIQWRVRQNLSCSTGGVLVLGEATLYGLPGEMPTESTTPTG